MPSVDGPATLTGTLSIAWNSPGGVFSAPAVGDSIPLFFDSAGSLAWGFNSENTHAVCGDKLIHFTYAHSTTDVLLLVYAIDPLTPGDFNADGQIDARDYVVWREEQGTHLAAADADRSGTVDTNDYNIWRAHFGSAAGAGSSADVVASVPEPAAWVMMIMGLIAMSGLVSPLRGSR